MVEAVVLAAALSPRRFSLNRHKGTRMAQTLIITGKLTFSNVFAPEPSFSKQNLFVQIHQPTFIPPPSPNFVHPMFPPSPWLRRIMGNIPFFVVSCIQFVCLLLVSSPRICFRTLREREVVYDDHVIVRQLVVVDEFL
jgi:hypothetical protein